MIEIDCRVIIAARANTPNRATRYPLRYPGSDDIDRDRLTAFGILNAQRSADF